MSPHTSRRLSSPSSSSDTIQDPNVFSDVYALESFTLPELSPFHDDEPSPISPDETGHPIPPSTRSIGPDSTASMHAQPRSTTCNTEPQGNVGPAAPTRSTSTASRVLSDGRSTSISSSHFSLPRSQSPYAGPTALSHPYGMYPQVTRASSTVSASTIRPPERSFVAYGGPGHPYAMYPQTTVSEEADDTLPSANPHLGFPTMRSTYQASTQRRQDDIADIVGSDGHVEQLPPYTRYAIEESTPKDNTRCVQSSPLSATEIPEIQLRPQSHQIQGAEDGLETNSAVSRNVSSDSGGSFKEKVKRKGRQRICCGLPLWFLLAIVVVLLFGVILGAVIGGMVGSKEVHEPSPQPNAVESFNPTATVTEMILDGKPLPTDLNLAEAPNGRFNVSLNNVEVSLQGCIDDSRLSAAWGCMPPTTLGFEVTGNSKDAQLVLDSHPVGDSPSRGAQLPNFDVNLLKLIPSADQDDQKLGPSLFAWTLYDKLTILHPEDILTKEERRETAEHGAMDPSVNPWFCWFNRTMLEFFIYLDKDLDDLPPTKLQRTTQLLTGTPTLEVPQSTSQASGPPFSPSLPASAAKSGPDTAEREYPEVDPHTGRPKTNGNPSHNEKRYRDMEYPRLMKIEEKRLPLNHEQYVAPYCRQMQILNDGRIVKAEEVDDIPIQEQGASEHSNAQRLRRELQLRRDHVSHHGDDENESDEEEEEEEGKFIRGGSYTDGGQNGVCACQWMNA